MACFASSFGEDTFERLVIGVFLKQGQAGHGTVHGVINEAIWSRAKHIKGYPHTAGLSLYVRVPFDLAGIAGVLA